jgi:hypothetical protein
MLRFFEIPENRANLNLIFQKVVLVRLGECCVRTYELEVKLLLLRCVLEPKCFARHIEQSS